MTTASGLVIRAQSGFFTVRTATHGDVVCQVRGRLKQNRQWGDLVAIGDHVTLSVQADGTGMIESVAERVRVLQRQAPSGRGRGGRAGQDEGRAQVIIANPDQVVFVFACAQPAPNRRALDRYLVMAEQAGVPALICANKADLVSPVEASELFGLYPPLGYPVIYTSATTGAGLAELRAHLQGKISGLAGPSGVGKSSLLNALQPGLRLRAQAVSGYTAKGRHTTVHPELIPLEAGGYLADTPGMRALALWDVELTELEGFFVEFRPWVADCEFNDCAHLNEPGCAIRRAVQAGHIHPSRYESYCRLRRGEA